MNVKKYYLHINGKQEGPFSIDELKQKGLEKDTLVWFEGVSNWTAISNIEELKGVYLVIPPPVIPPIINNSVNQNVVNNTDTKKKKDLIIGTIALLLIVVLAGYSLNAFLLNKSKDEVNADFTDTSSVLAIENQRKYIRDSITTVNRYIRNNILEFVTVDYEKPNIDYTLGGVSNFSIIIENNSQYKLDEVVCTVSYIKESGGVYDTEEVYFNDIPNKGTQSQIAKGRDRGTKVKVEISSINSKNLHICYSNINDNVQVEEAHASEASALEEVTSSENDPSYDPFYCR